jgi:hypothetical protein
MEQVHQEGYTIIIRGKRLTDNTEQQDFRRQKVNLTRNWAVRIVEQNRYWNIFVIGEDMW